MYRRSRRRRDARKVPAIHGASPNDRRELAALLALRERGEPAEQRVDEKRLALRAAEERRLQQLRRARARRGVLVQAARDDLLERARVVVRAAVAVELRRGLLHGLQQRLVRGLLRVRGAALCELERGDPEGPDVRGGVVLLSVDHLGCHPAWRADEGLALPELARIC